ncbi:MAG: nuclear transport factor 2 family protein [Candidatus Thiodiazotropha sp. (ex Ctena orbiculata)]|nr:nuclear transport factor 2 family protein [Candidatus Thiodiazotropha taylori]
MRFRLIVPLKRLTLIVLILFVGMAQATPSQQDQPREEAIPPISDSDAQLEGVRAVVKEMNRAITERDMAALLATFADGAIKIDLYSAHHYDNAKQKKDHKPIQTTDLAARWRRVAAILFSATRVYERTVESLQVHLDQGMAVAWASLKTRSQGQEQSALVKTNRYTESYLLRLVEGDWKIVAVTNNRKDKSRRK